MSLWQKAVRGVATRTHRHVQKLTQGLRSQGWTTWLRLQGARIGENAVLLPTAFLGDPGFLTVGDEAAIGNCSLMALAPLSIGRRAILNEELHILTGWHDLADPTFPLRTAPVTIGDYAWICTASIVYPGVTIGEGAVVAAGAVVRQDVAAWDVVAGNPAKVVAKRSARDLDYRPGLVSYLHFG